MSNFKCSFCGHSQAVSAKTQYIYKHDGELLIVNDVSCEECEFCGEQYFEASVLKQIEKDFQEIRKGNRKVRRLSIPVEQFA